MPLHHWSSRVAYMTCVWTVEMEPRQAEQVDCSVLKKPSSLSKSGRWTKEEHVLFLAGMKKHGKNWNAVAVVVGTRSAVQVRCHAQKFFQKLGRYFQRKGGKKGKIRDQYFSLKKNSKLFAGWLDYAGRHEGFKEAVKRANALPGIESTKRERNSTKSKGGVLRNVNNYQSPRKRRRSSGQSNYSRTSVNSGPICGITHNSEPDGVCRSSMGYLTKSECDTISPGLPSREQPPLFHPLSAEADLAFNEFPNLELPQTRFCHGANLEPPASGTGIPRRDSGEGPSPSKSESDDWFYDTLSELF